MLPTRFIPSLLFLCSFTLASSPSVPVSFSPSSSSGDPPVDFVAIATAFSPAPALLSQSTPQIASISAIDPSSPAPVKSAQVLAQHERELVEKRLGDLDRMVEDPKFLVETEEAYTLKADCKNFIRDFKLLIKIGSQGYSHIMQHQEEINAVTSKASAMVVSLASMNVAGAAVAISQLLPDVANLVRAVAPDLLEMLKAAAPVAARLLKSFVRIPANTVRKIKHKVRSYMCDAGGGSGKNQNRRRRKKMSESRLKKCIARGYFPKGYNPDKEYDLNSVNEDSVVPSDKSPLAEGESQKPALGKEDGKVENDNLRSAEITDSSEKKVRNVALVEGQITHDPFIHSKRRPRSKVAAPSTASPATAAPVVSVKEALPSQSNILPVKEEVPASDTQVSKIDMEK